MNDWVSKSITAVTAEKDSAAVALSTGCPWPVAGGTTQFGYAMDVAMNCSEHCEPTENLTEQLVGPSLTFSRNFPILINVGTFLSFHSVFLPSVASTQNYMLTSRSTPP